MIPGRRWDNATLPRRHREIADEWRGKGYLADVETVTIPRAVTLAEAFALVWGVVALVAVVAGIFIWLT